MEIPLALLESYLFVIDHFPDVTPNRWMLVSELLDKSRTSASYEASVAVVVGTSIGCLPKLFGGTAKDCRFDIITSQTGSRTTPKPHYKDAVFKDATRSAIKPLVLIPEINECCGKRVRIDPRASFPLVYIYHPRNSCCYNVSFLLFNVSNKVFLRLQGNWHRCGNPESVLFTHIFSAILSEYKHDDVRASPTR